MSSAPLPAWDDWATPLYIPVDVLMPWQDQNKGEMRASVLPHGDTAASHPNPTAVAAGITGPCACGHQRGVPAVLLNNGLEECLKLNISGQSDLQNRSEVSPHRRILESLISDKEI